MSANSKKSVGGTLLLVLLGVASLLAGPKWLVLLIPAASVVWYGTRFNLRGGRN
ncbi:MAG TPA: hypothetical protein VMH04_04920 [Candidatus Solibacter sp.]|nr:hypothetical protein [Candidatus Solibacter sp.]